MRRGRAAARRATCVPRPGPSRDARPRRPGAPKATWPPSPSRRRTRSASGRSAWRRCSMTTIDRSPLAARSARRWSTATVPGGSRLAVGSSRTRRRGSGARMSARARRCCSPPDRAPGGTRLEAGQAHLREGRRDGRQHPVAVPATVLQPEGDLVGNVRHHELRFGILEDEADLLAKDARRRARHLVVTDEQRAGPRAGQGVRHDPRQRAGERALAAPRWADDEQQLAGVQREADVVEGRAGPARVRPAEPVRANGRRGHAPPGKVSRTPVRRSAFRSHQPSSPASTMPEMTSTTAIAACTSSPNLSGG